MDVNIGCKITRKRRELRDGGVESCLPFSRTVCNIRLVNNVTRRSPLLNDARIGKTLSPTTIISLASVGMAKVKPTFIGKQN